ncbi:MAG: chorismate synthase [Clostridia bacterium]|nr:chorismate synthase [Clostridia bacterium]
MKNTFGNTVQVTLFGESHGVEIGIVIDGLAPGLTVDENNIVRQLSLRRPADDLSTPRQEPDEFRIVSGVFNGKTTGTPLTIIIPNTAFRSEDYEKTRSLARPGHADYAAYCKYHGFEDYRGGGHFSGRITAALTAAGAIALDVLRKKGIFIGTHIASCGGVKDVPFQRLDEDICALQGKSFATLSDEAGEAMRSVIRQAASEGDSVGGVLETAVTGIPAGVGEPWFDSVESVLSHILFSIPGIKAVEFGDGFAMAESRGSLSNDAFGMQEGKVITLTNHNGGINGGVTNGMPLVFRCGVKPTPSVSRKQETVDFVSGEEREIMVKGRHDPAIVHRARVVVDSVVALALCDMLAGRFGVDYLLEE